MTAPTLPPPPRAGKADPSGAKLRADQEGAAQSFVSFWGACFAGSREGRSTSSDSGNANPKGLAPRSQGWRFTEHASTWNKINPCCLRGKVGFTIHVY